jgi:Ser/Thr protein kinase RdoA (MazF antagonist)
VPQEIKERVSSVLGSAVARAERVYGGYAPSATFRLRLASDERAFFKASYPTPKGSGVRWFMAHEDRNYRRLGARIRPWAPRFLGSFHHGGWYVLLLEDLGPRTMPPWTAGKARRAARSYAAFHQRSVGKPLPRWLSRAGYKEHARFWRDLAKTNEIGGTASLARRRTDEAREWLDVALPLMVEQERRLLRAKAPFALLHFDTRSDNCRLQGDLLRIFDWPFASAGPPEFDVVAFCQGVAAEGGPAVERILGWYQEVLPLRAEMIDASLAGLAGYFADRAWRPPVEGLPRLRPFQRRQLKACLAWAARRLDLPEPRWLAAVPD